jgi:hypothetical protein
MGYQGTQVVEYRLNKCEAQCSNPNAIKKERKKGRERERE